MRLQLVLTSLLLGACTSPSIRESSDPLVGEFRLEVSSRETHKFWKEGPRYLYASCTERRCSDPQPARMLADEDISWLFQPDDRWKRLDVKGITADGTGLSIFHVAHPDARILERTSTGYVFRFWIMSGSAQRMGDAP
jgi:hypothetical protein